MISFEKFRKTNISESAMYKVKLLNLFMQGIKFSKIIYLMIAYLVNSKCEPTECGHSDLMITKSQQIKCVVLSVFCVMRNTTKSKASEHYKGGLTQTTENILRMAILTISSKLFLTYVASLTLQQKIWIGFQPFVMCSG